MVLRHEVRLLKRQLHGRVRYRTTDRASLAALSRLLPRWRWRCFLVTPETLLRWHRELSRRKWKRWRAQRGPGRPPLRDEVAELIVRLGRENRRWGCVRIQGELRGLGVRISASSIRRVLHPTGFFVTQVARNLAGDLTENGRSFRFLIRDRDAKFTASFDEVFASEGIEEIRTPVRSPRVNAIAERWVRTVREECLDWTLVLRRNHLEAVLRDYVRHYNQHRPHRGLRLQVPAPLSEVTSASPSLSDIARHDVLGGIIHEYQAAA